MKKGIKILSTLLLIIIVIGAVIGGVYFLTRRLPAPNLVYDAQNDKLYWDEVKDAELYKITIDGQEEAKEYNNNFFILGDRFAFGDHTIQVVSSTANRKLFLKNSKPAEIKVKKLLPAKDVTPILIAKSANQLDIQFDSYAKYYDSVEITVLLGTEEYLKQTFDFSTGNTLTININQDGYYFVKVVAKAKEPTRKDYRSYSDDGSSDKLAKFYWDQAKINEQISRYTATINKLEIDKKNGADFIQAQINATPYPHSAIFTCDTREINGEYKQSTGVFKTTISALEYVETGDAKPIQLLLKVLKSDQYYFESSLNSNTLTIVDSREPIVSESYTNDKYVINTPPPFESRLNFYDHKLQSIKVLYNGIERELNSDDYNIIGPNFGNYEKASTINFLKTIGQVFSLDEQDMVGESVKFIYNFTYNSNPYSLEQTFSIVDSVEARSENSVYYFKYNTSDAVAIKLLGIKGKVNITSINGALNQEIYTNLDNDKVTFNKDTSVLTISNSYMSQFDIGAVVPIKINLEHALNNSILIDIRVTPHYVPLAEQQIYTYSEVEDNIVKVIFNSQEPSGIAGYSFVGLHIDNIAFGNPQEDKYSVFGNEITFNNGYLKTLSDGIHRIGIRYEYTASDGRKREYATFFSLDIVRSAIHDFVVSRNNYSISNKKYEISFNAPRGYDSFDIVTNSENISNIRVKKAEIVVSPLVAQSVQITAKSSTGKPNINKTFNISALDDVASNYLLKKYSFLGQRRTLYIETKQDIHDLGYYLFVYGSLTQEQAANPLYKYNVDQILTYHNVYGKRAAQVNVYSDAYNSSSIKNALEDYWQNYFPEAYSYGSSQFSVTGAGNEMTISVPIYSGYIPNIKTNLATDTYRNLVANESHGDYVKTNNTFAKNKRPISFNDFAINNRPETEIAISIVDEMIYAMQEGYKPKLTPGSPAEEIYNQALSILREIVNDEMSPFEKIAAIYEKIIYMTRYDHAVVKNMPSNSSSEEYVKYYRHSAFYAEGVFQDGLAVCNGFAKAFIILTRIEGIESYKCDGMAGKDAGASYNPDNGEKHAWNKVRVGDYWYIIDATWGNRDAKVVTEPLNRDYMSRDYLFVENKEVDGSYYSYDENSRKRMHHEIPTNETKNYIASDSFYNVYANMFIMSGGKVYDHYIHDWNKEEASGGIAALKNEAMLNSQVNSGTSFFEVQVVAFNLNNADSYLQKYFAKIHDYMDVTGGSYHYVRFSDKRGHELYLK